MKRIAAAIIIILLLAWSAAAAGDLVAFQGDLEDLERSGEKVSGLRIPLYLTLRSWEGRPFGLRGRLAGTFAVSDLSRFPEGFEKVRMVSIVPGLELVVPLGRHHVLRPFLDAGVGVQSRTDEEVLLLSGGLRAEFVFAGGRYLYGLEPGFQVDNRSGPDLESGAVLRPFVTLGVRRDLGFAVAGHRTDGGLYFEAGYDFNAIELASVRSVRDAVRTNLEAGIGFGFSRTRPKVWFVPVPRVRVGYRFGDLEGWRVRLGGDWLRAVTNAPSPSP